MKLRTSAPNADEPFEFFDIDNQYLGTTTREAVHTQGLWHRSAQVFVFNRNGQLLVQKRAADKDLYPGLWDYSVGEHLQPGESYLAGAYRGLTEELAIQTDVPLEPIGPQRRVSWQGDNFLDQEIQQAFRLDYSGAIRWDRQEVQFCWFVDLAHLKHWIQMEEEAFTPWFTQDLREFGWL